MELDDLRRRWQHQPADAPTEPSLTQQKLQAMLANQTDTPVSKMLRNTRKEQRLLLLLLILNWGNISNMVNRYQNNAPFLSQFLLYGSVGLMVAFIAWTTYRKRKIITQLQATDTSTYSHLSQSINQIRHLMRNKLYAGIVFLVSIVLAALYARYDDMMQAVHTNSVDWGLTILVIFAGAMFTGVLLHLDVRMQQRRYGQYLDQMEATLQELEDEGK